MLRSLMKTYVLMFYESVKIMFYESVRGMQPMARELCYSFIYGNTEYRHIIDYKNTTHTI